ncbi:MAG: hypothetical protein WC683_13635 [bacterium]
MSMKSVLVQAMTAALMVAAVPSVELWTRSCVALAPPSVVKVSETVTVVPDVNVTALAVVWLAGWRVILAQVKAPLTVCVEPASVKLAPSQSRGPSASVPVPEIVNAAVFALMVVLIAVAFAEFTPVQVMTDVPRFRVLETAQSGLNTPHEMAKLPVVNVPCCGDTLPVVVRASPRVRVPVNVPPALSSILQVRASPLVVRVAAPAPLTQAKLPVAE